MRIDNPLTREFLLNFPSEAARIMEQMSSEYVTVLFSELPAKSSVAVMASMLPDKVASCLETMQPLPAAKLFAELPVSYAVRVYRLMTIESRDLMSSQLTERNHRNLHRYLKYPSASVGALLDPVVDMLPAELSVSGAMRAVNRFRHPASCEIYIIDRAQHLTGMIDLGVLLKSSNHLKLTDVMKRKTQQVSAYAKAESMLTHPGWATRHSLPVVDRDNTLIGVLDYNRLRDSLGEIEEASPTDPAEKLMSFAGLYWLTVAQLIDSVFSIAGSNKGGRS